MINLEKSSFPDLNSELLETDSVHDIEAADNGVHQYELDATSITDKDTFKCGKCKTQFQALSRFMEHKRTQCGYHKMTEKKTEKKSGGKIHLPVAFLSSDNNNKASSDTSTLHAINEADGFIDLTDEANAAGVLSLIVGNDQVFFANPLELTELANQIKLTPNGKNKNEYTMANEEMRITTNNFDDYDKDVVDNVISICPSGDKEENNRFLTAEIISNSSIINFEQDLSKVKDTENIGLNYQNNMILELQYGNENLMKPIKTDRIKSKLPCSYCGKLFEKPFNLQQHERVHTGERPFQCVICGRAFSQKANVRKHMVRHKVWPHAKQTLKINIDQNQKNLNEHDKLDRTSYSCQYCSLSFSSYSLHKKHLAVHSDFKVYRCIQKGCVETFSDLDEFLSHSESHSSVEFQCHVCLKMFSSLVELGSHQYDHDLPKQIRKDFKIKLKCDICHAQFKSAESLKNHLTVDTHNYECPHCKSVFSCERFLRRHLATHSNPSESKFECEFCNKTFKTEKYLKNHSFTHSKEKPFNCELCNKQFASKYRLKRHLAIHLSQYLECPFKMYLGCDKKFYRKDKLRNHVSSHCHLKIRSCQVCSKTFNSFAKLQQHIKREHKVDNKKQILKCVNCLQTFRKQKQLFQHHCTVDEKKFKSRIRNDLKLKKFDGGNPELVSNIEIIMVPYMTNSELIK